MDLGSCPFGRTIDDASRRGRRADRDDAPGRVEPMAGGSGSPPSARSRFASPSPWPRAWAGAPIALDLQPAGRSGGPFLFVAAALALALALAWGWRTGAGTLAPPPPPGVDWPIGPDASNSTPTALEGGRSWA